jgi:hypothetical protein
VAKKQQIRARAKKYPAVQPVDPDKSATPAPFNAAAAVYRQALENALSWIAARYNIDPE